MSDESILILNMLREGKITADQADNLLKAVRPVAEPYGYLKNAPPAPPPTPAATPADPVALTQMQTKLGDLQGKLAELQGKLHGAQAARTAGQAASLLGRAFEHMPKPDLDYSKINKSMDEALRGLSSLKNDALRTAKVAARQAGQDARRAARDGRRAVDDITAPWTTRSDDAVRRPINTDDKRQALDTMESIVNWDGASSLVISNTYGHLTLTGRDDTDAEARGTVAKTAWADTEAEARVLLQQVFLTSRVEGGKCRIEIVAPADAQGRLTVDVTLSVPRGIALEVETTHGELTLEETSAHSNARTGSGRLTARRPWEGTPGEALLQTRSGALCMEGWNAPQTALTAQTASADMAGEGLSCRSLTLSSRSGDIELHRIQTVGDAVIENISGDCDIAGGSVGGRLQTKTQSGSIQAADLRAAQVSLETVSGRAQADSVTGAVTIKTISGDIKGIAIAGAAASIGTISGDAHIAFAAPFSGSLAATSVSGDLRIGLWSNSDTRVEMSTTTGDLHCRLPLSETSASGERMMSGLLGGGVGSLKLQSVSGDLTLEEQR